MAPRIDIEPESLSALKAEMSPPAAQPATDSDSAEGAEEDSAAPMFDHMFRADD